MCEVFSLSLTCLCFLSPATQCWNRQPAAVLPAQNPRLAPAPSQCAKREGRRLTHAVVLVKGRRTLCLLLANFSAVCFFKYISHLLPWHIFSLYIQSSSYDPGVPLPVLIPTPPYSVFRYASHIRHCSFLGCDCTLSGSINSTDLHCVQPINVRYDLTVFLQKIITLTELKMTVRQTPLSAHLSVSISPREPLAPSNLTAS